MANNPEEYRRFFDAEFEKYYKTLSADFPTDMDVGLELNRRFKDYEVRLESNETKVSVSSGEHQRQVHFSANKVRNDK